MAGNRRLSVKPAVASRHPKQLRKESEEVIETVRRDPEEEVPLSPILLNILGPVVLVENGDHVPKIIRGTSV